MNNASAPTPLQRERRVMTGEFDAKQPAKKQKDERTRMVRIWLMPMNL